MKSMVYKVGSFAVKASFEFIMMMGVTLGVGIFVALFAVVAMVLWYGRSEPPQETVWAASIVSSAIGAWAGVKVLTARGY